MELLAIKRSNAGSISTTSPITFSSDQSHLEGIRRRV